MPVETELSQAEIQTTVQQVFVDVTEVDSVEVVTATLTEDPVIVTTGIVGPQGPAFTLPSLRHEFSDPYDYCGIASGGTLDGDPDWTITRLTIASNGSTTSGVATAVTWTGRASHTYT